MELSELFYIYSRTIKLENPDNFIGYNGARISIATVMQGALVVRGKLAVYSLLLT